MAQASLQPACRSHRAFREAKGKLMQWLASIQWGDVCRHADLHSIVTMKDLLAIEAWK
jgi:hypothetical protein